MKMPIDGYVDYKKREFCKDIECKVQIRLNNQDSGSNEYEKIRQECRDCMAWQFHHWLNERGYVVVKPED